MVRLSQSGPEREPAPLMRGRLPSVLSVSFLFRAASPLQQAAEHHGQLPRVAVRVPSYRAPTIPRAWAMAA